MKNRAAKACIIFCVWLVVTCGLVFLADMQEVTISEMIGTIMLIVFNMFIGMIVPLIAFLLNKRNYLSRGKGITICVMNSVTIFALVIFLATIYNYYSITYIEFIFLFFVESNKDKIQRDSIEISDNSVIEYNTKEKIDIFDENKPIDEKIDILETENKHCTKCGKEISDDWDYCYHCGNKLK